MRPELEIRLKGQCNFPSPPGVAQQIIELAQDPEAEVSRIAETIGRDSGLTAKILRTANSPIYAQRRRSQNLRQAVLVLGLNATVTLALSFSLVASLRTGRTRGIDYPLYWRRTLLAAIASRALGEAAGIKQTEDLMLAGLLQDIGVLALDRSRLGFYDEMPVDADSAAQLKYERGQLGDDHAAVGAWLLRSWNLPELLCLTVERSHSPELGVADKEMDRFIRCVALGGELAEMFVSNNRAQVLTQLMPRARKLLDLDQKQLGDVIANIAQLIPETEQLFEVSILEADSATFIMEQAREILAMRSLQSLNEIHALKQTTDSLAARTEALEDAGRRDGLTGVYNRAWMDQRLQGEFESASHSNWPLSIAFIDLDHFKRINDSHGHQAGDRVLRLTAQLLQTSVRETDIVARYGGEEFVIIFPGLDHESAHSACERILTALRATQLMVGDATVTITASLGIATHSRQAPFASAAKLVHGADIAVYTAKHNGRNRIEYFRNRATISA